MRGPSGMEQVYVVAGLAALFVAVVLTLVVRRRLSRAFARRRARRRSRRAVQGEVRAETLLEELGYVIEGRQVPCSWTVLVDGDERTFPIRADLIVTRGAERFVAEVKTGAKAPRLTTAATRRQLLEYRMAYDVDGVLLVDAEANRVIDVDFPVPGPGPSSLGWLSLVSVWLFGAAAGALGVWLAR